MMPGLIMMTLVHWCMHMHKETKFLLTKNFGLMFFYKIIQIVHALRLAIKPFYMSVCKHGFCSSFISYHSLVLYTFSIIVLGEFV